MKPMKYKEFLLKHNPLILAMSAKQSDSFNQNRFFWTLLGLWPGKIPNKYYKYYSFTYITLFFVIYNIFLTLNVYYTPRKIEAMIREIIFFFTEITVGFKVSMVFLKRKKISAIFKMLDCEKFKGNDDIGKKIVKKHNDFYQKYLISFGTLSTFTLSSLVFLPVFGSLIFKYTLQLPICKYYFLSDETRNDYFTLFFVYQSVGMYGHMIFNVSTDTLIAGYMVLAIGQVKVLHHDLGKLKIEKTDVGSPESLDLKLRKIVKHYGLLLEYCKEFQDVVNVAVFVQFAVGTAIVCVCMCGFLLPPTVETYTFMVGYFAAMNLEIFVPAWLGTQLKYESHELMSAAYTSEWLPRSEHFKRSLKLFVERAKKPVIISGLKMFPLSLATYISIMKTSYSCFALLRIIQDRQEPATATQ